MNGPGEREIEKFRYLWTTGKDDYLLVRDANEAMPLIVTPTKKYPEALSIGDDVLSSAVKQRMAEAGVRLVTWDALKEEMRRRSGGGSAGVESHSLLRLPPRVDDRDSDALGRRSRG